MYLFNCDYNEGAHPKILERLNKTNFDQHIGYGSDEICAAAREKIKIATKNKKADVHFLVGGTQSNYTVIDSILKNYEGVISVKSGHINVHEAGAIEFSGHKVLDIDGADGKLIPEKVKEYLVEFYNDGSYTHMVKPGAIYISHPTEYGTLYTKNELKALRKICDEYSLKLFLDGARLGYGLAADNTDVTLPDIAKYTDVFYIGGTKVGALFGEAVVFKNKEISPDFFTEMKQHGAVLAKGRLLGIQFDELFTDNLYFEISKKAIRLAMRIKKEVSALGLEEYIDSYTNQQFFYIDKPLFDKMSKDFLFDVWPSDRPDKIVIRITTSWATPEAAADSLINKFKENMEK